MGCAILSPRGITLKKSNVFVSNRIIAFRKVSHQAWVTVVEGGRGEGA
jgi:hypothetical protein